MTGQPKRCRACSIAYLHLFYRQQLGQLAYPHAQLTNYLRFCLERGLLIHPQSVTVFNQQRTANPFIRLSRFLNLYQQMGSPPLLPSEQLGGMPHVGSYLLSELIQYWYWPPWRTQAEEIAIGRGLLTWWDYLIRVDKAPLSVIDSVESYLKHEHNHGISDEILKQRVVVIRRWAKWVLERATPLRLTQQDQALLRSINQLTTGKSPWIVGADQQWDYTSPEANALHVEQVAPLVYSLMRRGMSLANLQQIRVRHIHFRYIDSSTIELDKGLSWDLKPDDSRRLRVYLRTTDRLQWPILTLDEHLFSETHWDTLWRLSRQFLRLYRRRSQRDKAQRRALANRSSPIYFVPYGLINSLFNPTNDLDR